MICPECSSPLHRTVFTRQSDDDKVMRRKKCAHCGHGWYSVEVILDPKAVLHTHERDGTRGLRLAKGHRNITFR